MPSQSSVRGRRVLLVIAAAIGIGLVAAPFAFNMFVRAPKGAVMLSDFKPFMTTQRLDGFQTDIGEINAAVQRVDSVKPPSATSDATYRSFDQQWPAINTEMTDLLDKVQANLGNYQAVAALPSFRLFPWFFVIPGVFIAAAAGFALRRPDSHRVQRTTRVVLVALGIGLIVAPAVFSMFTRAPKGGHMMTAFADIETTQKVERIQNYFSSMALGQGELRLHIAPALARSGTQLGAVNTLNSDWVHILNDMTPMIGAMSDNVPNYQAIKALPPFPLFPWFFVVPGVLVAGLALADRTRIVAHTPQPSPQRAPAQIQGAA